MRVELKWIMNECIEARSRGARRLDTQRSNIDYISHLTHQMSVTHLIVYLYIQSKLI